MKRSAGIDDNSRDVVLDFEPVKLVAPSRIREVLLDEYDQWAGTPYRLGGEGRRGIDCSALMQQVFRSSFDFELPRTTNEQILEGQRIDKDALRPGDLVFFQPSRRLRHVGVYVGEGYFLHASTSQGVKLSRLDNVFWSRHYLQARRPLDNAQLAMRAGSASSNANQGFLASAEY
ncbi:C40 family peptidase [Halotalea alkalilenta]|uniref:C40 family peptidase n=1 Tax=Halotalea alkalilenta TaxID=376489 RepID=UPI000A917A20|nr:NlpC/P60 family protein [Halotalea alkalilenta]